MDHFSLARWAWFTNFRVWFWIFRIKFNIAIIFTRYVFKKSWTTSQNDKLWSWSLIIFLKVTKINYNQRKKKQCLNMSFLSVLISSSTCITFLSRTHYSSTLKISNSKMGHFDQKWLQLLQLIADCKLVATIADSWLQLQPAETMITMDFCNELANSYQLQQLQPATHSSNQLAIRFEQRFSNLHYSSALKISNSKMGQKWCVTCKIYDHE